MKQLVITCRFIAHSYQGRRSTLGMRDELEWPPSPARLHQALISTALTGRHTGDPEIQSFLVALRWMECLPAPEIVATKLMDAARTRPRVAIPQNNYDKKSKLGLLSNSVLLAPSDKAVAHEDELAVSYLWPLVEPVTEAAAHSHFNSLSELVAQAPYLGRAEDRIEASAEISATDAVLQLDPFSSERWLPCEEFDETELWLPQPNTTDRLIARHVGIAMARERKDDVQRHLCRQGYSTQRAHARLPVVVSIFQLFPLGDDPDALPLSFDTDNPSRWRSPMRELAIRTAETRDFWDNADLACELISGHQPGNSKPSEQPHLAFVPLPSITASGKADGRVRRMGLLGFSNDSSASAAKDIYTTLAMTLDGEILNINGLDARLRLLDKPANQDAIWSQLVGTSRVWHTLTPVALVRGFKTPKMIPDGSRALTSNERHQHRQILGTALLRDSLRHAGMPERIVATCEICLTASPLITATTRAENYRAPNDSVVVNHARIEFSEPIRGPLLIGDRRYQGLGLFLPAK